MNTTEDNGFEETQSPTVTPNKCQELEPGDIVILMLTSIDPDAVAFFPLIDIYPEVGSLYLTDKAWTGIEFVDGGESTRELEIPPQGLFVGEYFGYGEYSTEESLYGDNWTFPVFETNELFDISTRGDQLLLYCLSADGDPHFIWGMNFNGDWVAKNLTDYGPATSALPDTLVETGNVALPYCKNYLWRDPSPDELVNRTLTKKKFTDPENYVCDNTTRFVLQSTAPNVAVWPSFLALGTIFLAFLM